MCLHRQREREVEKKGSALPSHSTVNVLCTCEWVPSRSGLGDGDLGFYRVLVAWLSALLWSQALSSLRRQDHRGTRESPSSFRSSQGPQMYKPWNIGWGWVGSVIYWLEVGTRHRGCLCLPKCTRLAWAKRGLWISSWRDGLKETQRMQTEVVSLCSDCASKILRNLEEQFSAQQPWESI